MTTTLSVFLFIAASTVVVSLIFLALFSHQRAVGVPGESRADEFEDAFMRWMVAKREFPKLQHDDCAPLASSYGLSEETANRIRDRVRRDFERSA